MRNCNCTTFKLPQNNYWDIGCYSRWLRAIYTRRFLDLDSSDNICLFHHFQITCSLGPAMFNNVFLCKSIENLLFLLSIKIITKNPQFFSAFPVSEQKPADAAFVKFMYQCFIRRGNSYKRSVIRVQNTFDLWGLWQLQTLSIRYVFLMAIRIEMNSLVT